MHTYHGLNIQPHFPQNGNEEMTFAGTQPKYRKRNTLNQKDGVYDGI